MYWRYVNVGHVKRIGNSSRILESRCFYIKARVTWPAGKLVLTEERVTFLPSRLFWKSPSISINLKEIIAAGSKELRFWQTLWHTGGFEPTLANPWGFPFLKAKILTIKTVRNEYEFLLSDVERWLTRIKERTRKLSLQKNPR